MSIELKELIEAALNFARLMDISNARLNKEETLAFDALVAALEKAGLKLVEDEE